ncbi:MAG: CCA tRNA nucleotidyltransferase [Acidaminococcaceae bacterium]
MTKIIMLLQGAGYEAHVVGGAVRDLLLGRLPEDYDVTTNAQPDAIIELAQANKIVVVDKLGYNFGVVLLLSDGYGIEVATYRGERYGRDAHKPEQVWYCQTLREDLARRDFTINALALDNSGNILDYFGGREDLKAKVLRTVGEAQVRFAEDGLRMFRACRFVAQLNLNYQGSLQFPLERVQGLALERVRIELEKTLLAPAVAKGLRLLGVTGLLSTSCQARVAGNVEQVALLPELEHLQALPQNPRFHCYDVWEHTLAAVAGVAPSLVLRWAMLLHDVGKGLAGVRQLTAAGQPSDHGHEQQSALLAQAILVRLGYKTSFVQRVTWLVSRHMRFAPLLLTGEKSLYHWVRKEAQSGCFRYQWELVEAFTQLVQVFLADMGATQAGKNSELMDSGIALGERVLALARQMPVHTSDLALTGGAVAAVVGTQQQVGVVLRLLLLRVQSGELPNTQAELLQATTLWHQKQQRRSF